MASRFTLRVGRWYACEIIGDEFDEDLCSYSPSRVRRVDPLHTGRRRLRLGFYHANYPEGVRDKVYELAVLERARRFLLARSTEHDPTRVLQIYGIDRPWIERHFPGARALTGLEKVASPRKPSARGPHPAASLAPSRSPSSDSSRTSRA